MNFLFFGSTGRIGKLVLEVLRDGNNEVFFASRHGISAPNGDFRKYADWRPSHVDHPMIVVDASVDLSSEGALRLHEQIKASVIEALLSQDAVTSYIGFSSGAAQFSEKLIQDSKYREYARLKRKMEDFLKGLEIPVFYPELFTLIGPISYQTKSTGWVNVLDKCLNDLKVTIAEPFELRSWVAEDTLFQYLRAFISAPDGQHFGALIDGCFCLQDIVDLVSSAKNKQIVVEGKESEKWLATAYINQNRSYFMRDYDIKATPNFNKQITSLLDIQNQ
jgi:hypothetical protein